MTYGILKGEIDCRIENQEELKKYIISELEHLKACKVESFSNQLMFRRPH